MPATPFLAQALFKVHPPRGPTPPLPGEKDSQKRHFSFEHNTMPPPPIVFYLRTLWGPLCSVRRKKPVFGYPFPRGGEGWVPSGGVDKVCFSLGSGMVLADVENIYYSLGSGMVLADVGQSISFLRSWHGCGRCGQRMLFLRVWLGCGRCGKRMLSLRFWPGCGPKPGEHQRPGVPREGPRGRSEAYHRHQQETCIRHCSHTEGTAHASLCTAAVCAKHTEYHSVERRREETGRSGAGWLRTERAELEARERPRAVQRKWKGPQTESGVGRNKRLSQRKESGPRR